MTGKYIMAKKIRINVTITEELHKKAQEISILELGNVNVSQLIRVLIKNYKSKK
jgi:hypothetical protein